jgi:hypothetical protein
VDQYATEAVSAQTAPEQAHEVTECSRLRYAMRSVVWHLLTGFSVSGLCCGVPAAGYATTELPMPRPVWWKHEAKRGLNDIERFLS